MYLCKRRARFVRIPHGAKRLPLRLLQGQPLLQQRVEMILHVFHQLLLHGGAIRLEADVRGCAAAPALEGKPVVSHCLMPPRVRSPARRRSPFRKKSAIPPFCPATAPALRV